LEAWTGARAHLRILSNLADRRLARARAVWRAGAIGAETVEGVALAARFADADPYRAATHNKGILNGVSALTLATGNDTRAIESGAHAYAARTGRYRALSAFETTPEGDLAGTIELPCALGLVGGATKAHPIARACLAILGVESADHLARIAAAIGLAQNFAALRALATTGIQKGHMKLHAQNVAIAAGAEGDEVAEVAARMNERGSVRHDVAKQILAELRGAGE
jgi:hydroxymethylglutaryl-CoA reductase